MGLSWILRVFVKSLFLILFLFRSVLDYSNIRLRSVQRKTVAVYKVSRGRVESTSVISALQREALRVCLSKTVFIRVHFSCSGRKPDPTLSFRPSQFRSRHYYWRKIDMVTLVLHYWQYLNIWFCNREEMMELLNFKSLDNNQLWGQFWMLT